MTYSWRTLKNDNCILLDNEILNDTYEYFKLNVIPMNHS